MLVVDLARRMQVHLISPYQSGRPCCGSSEEEVRSYAAGCIPMWSSKVIIEKQTAGTEAKDKVDAEACSLW